MEDSRIVVAMDIEMPVMDGMTASQKIREYERYNNLKPVLLNDGEWELCGINN